MTVAIGAIVGFLAGRLTWILLRPAMGSPSLRRTNFRGREVPTAAGVAIPLAVALVEAGRTVAGRLGFGEPDATSGTRAAVLVACTGFALLGLFDDLAGSGDRRGFRGHLSALARGRLTTGGTKLVGGVALGLVLAAPYAGHGVVQLVADAALIALAANLANLLDRAPGRTGKATLVAFAALAAATAAPRALTAAAVVIGAAAALLLDDLRERLMLGDAGANALGAVLGLAVVQTTVPHVRLIVTAVLLGANLLSELVSFSRVIEAVPPLRALDQAGRR